MIFLQLAHRHTHITIATLTPHPNLHPAAHFGLRNNPRQAAHGANLVPIKLDDHVAAFNPRFRGRAPIGDAGNQRAFGPFHAQAFGDLIGHGLHPHAEPAAPHFAVLDNLPHNQLGGRCRDRKADADGPARRGDDRAVHAHHIAVHIEQRSARVAPVDGRVCLNEVIIEAGIDVAVARGDNPRRHRAAETEGIADGHDPVAHARVVGIAKGYSRKPVGGVHTQNRDVGGFVRADECRVERCAVGKGHRHRVGAGHHVIVRDDDAVFVDDKAGAERGGLLRHGRGIGVAFQPIAKQVAKGMARRKLFKGNAVFTFGAHILRGGNIHHRGRQPVGEISECIGGIAPLGGRRIGDDSAGDHDQSRKGGGDAAPRENLILQHEKLPLPLPLAHLRTYAARGASVKPRGPICRDPSHRILTMPVILLCLGLTFQGVSPE